MTERLRIRASTPEDESPIRTCLVEAGLDAGDIAPFLGDFLVAEEAGAVIGTIGLERYGTSGLLRSAAVRPEHRSGGTGRRLVEALERRAAGTGIRELYLLTTTAADYFARRGYSVVERSSVTGDVLRSEQFRGACPSTAVVMRKEIPG